MLIFLHYSSQIIVYQYYWSVSANQQMPVWWEMKPIVDCQPLPFIPSGELLILVWIPGTITCLYELIVDNQFKSTTTILRNLIHYNNHQQIVKFCPFSIKNNLYIYIKHWGINSTSIWFDIYAQIILPFFFSSPVHQSYLVSSLVITGGTWCYCTASWQPGGYKSHDNKIHTARLKSHLSSRRKFCSAEILDPTFFPYGKKSPRFCV